MTQGHIFLYFAASGALFGGLYAGLEWLRRKVPHRRVMIYGEDILVVLTLGGCVYGLFLWLNQGILRGYGFLGVALGFGMVYEGSRRLRKLFRKKSEGKSDQTR